ncbi:MAG: hypothetical protein WAT78_13705 [Rhizobiaceae bacterium]
MNRTKPDQTPVTIWTPWGRMETALKPQVRLGKSGQARDFTLWLARKPQARKNGVQPA